MGIASLDIGPANGVLRLRTTRQGLAATVGHDLTIEVTSWSGVVVLADDPADSTLRVTVDTGSLRVLAGTGGLKPLSESDKKDILGRARKILDVDASPQATYVSTSITEDTITGTLTLRGVAREVRLALIRAADGGYAATGMITQSEFGIVPYSAMFGALKLADQVGVEIEINVSAR